MTKINEDLFLQKSGICIGLKVAPVLSEVYLRVIDMAVVEAMEAVPKESVLVRR